MMDNRNLNNSDDNLYREDISSNSNDISSNSFDDKDLFSYDNSNNVVNDEANSFDLNSFSTKSINEERERRRSKKGKSSTKQRVLMTLLSVFLIGVITVSIVVGAFLFYAFVMVDGTMDEDLENSLDFTTTIYVDSGDGNYKEYRRMHGEYNRIWVDYDRVAIEKKDPDYKGIPETLANAFVAIEDKRFFDHDGIDWKRTFGAFINEFVPIYSSRQGGSTITQQLVKNITKDTEQNARRKIQEIMRARFLEGKFSKETILEYYLNTIPLDHGLHGVSVAANYYFGKSVHELSLVECAAIAAITKSPSNYSPDSNPENNKERRNEVLYQMYDQGYITKSEYNAAKKAELTIVADDNIRNQDEINSYFVDALIDEVVADLCATYNYNESYANNLFFTGGYKIYATVDPDIQAAAEKVYSDSKTYGVIGADGKPLNGAITVMDYNGNVKALVGGIGVKDRNRGLNCATDAIRQPGSTMKPIAAYAPAIEQNLITYSTLVNDTKATYRNWSPVNWYNSYWGNITVQYALERSVNTIPVYLVNKMGPQICFDFLTQKLGVTTLTREDVNLSPLGMGGTNGGLTTKESAAAFAVFGNGGLYYEPSLYTKVTNQAGDIILEKKSKPKMAISEDTATVMNHLLQTVVYGANGTGKAAASYIPNMKIYAKTGTSNDQNDLWFVGGTPYYIASCWCGYDIQQPIASKHSGIALKMWGNVMSQVHKGLKAKNFTDSSYTVEKFYCTATGKLATNACPSRAIGWYKKSYIPGACTSHSGTLLGKPQDVLAKEEAEKNNATQSSSQNASSGNTSSGSSASSSNPSSGSTSSANSSNSTAAN